MNAPARGSPPGKEKPPPAGEGKLNETTEDYGKRPRLQAPLVLQEAQRIAESIVGTVSWRGAEGFCRCPGEDRHTTQTAPDHCKVVCEPVAKSGGLLAPGVYCFHSSCAADCEGASHALRSALGSRGAVRSCQSARHPVIPKPKPEFAPAKLASIAAKLPGVDAAWLAARSPLRPDTRTPALFLAALYHPGEKVLVFDVFESQGQTLWTCKEPPCDTRELDSFSIGKPRGVWFLTNPVDGEFRENDRGEQSRRSWQNVTSWRYLVLESDKADPAHWLGALAQMPLRMAAIYTSGWKSIHALVRLDAPSKAHWDALRDGMKSTLVILGADHKALSAVRLSRLPCCERVEKGAMQTLLYLNPHPTRTPICDLPVLDDPEADAKRWAQPEAFL